MLMRRPAGVDEYRVAPPAAADGDTAAEQPEGALVSADLPPAARHRWLGGVRGGVRQAGGQGQGLRRPPLPSPPLHHQAAQERCGEIVATKG